MGLIRIDWHPPPKDLRVFSTAFLVAAGLLGAWLRFGHGAAWPAALAPWGAGAAVFAAGVVRPAAVRPVYVAMMAVALPIGLVVSTTVLAVLYYLILTPIGLAMRLSGRDHLGRRIDPAARTYWVPRRPPDSVRRYFRQF